MQTAVVQPVVSFVSLVLLTDGKYNPVVVSVTQHLTGRGRKQPTYISLDRGETSLRDLAGRGRKQPTILDWSGEKPTYDVKLVGEETSLRYLIGRGRNQPTTFDWSGEKPAYDI